MFNCPRWGCPLENVVEYQQKDCEKYGMDCWDCMEQAENESNEGDGFEPCEKPGEG